LIRVPSGKGKRALGRKGGRAADQGKLRRLGARQSNEADCQL